MADSIPNIDFEVNAAGVVTVPIDDTLSIAGQAADAKAVGDALALKADRSELTQTIRVNGQAADLQGEIIVTADEINMDDNDTSTIAEEIEALKERTGADIPVNGAAGAASIEDALTAAVEGAMPANPPAIELTPASGAPNGGFIDFHFGGQDVDYTVRLIELVQGLLHITGGLTLGTALGIGSGGTGATTAYDGVENLGVSLAFNGTWTLEDMYPKMRKVPVPGSALLWVSPSAIRLLSGDKITTYCTVVASRENASDWRFMAFHGNDPYVFFWHITGWTSASATPTIGTVYRLAGTAI